MRTFADVKTNDKSDMFYIYQLSLSFSLFTSLKPIYIIKSRNYGIKFKLYKSHYFESLLKQF